MSTVIHWFRRDLRLTDNRALNAALNSGLEVIPLFIFDERVYRAERSSNSRTAFLLAGLHALDEELHQLSSALLVRHGDPLSVLQKLLEETGAHAVYFNRDYSPYARQRDRAVAQALGAERIHSEHDLLMHPPMSVMTAENNPYTVFTPFKRRWLELPKQDVETAAGRWFDPAGLPSLPIPSLEALSTGTAVELPPAGQAAALARLERFRHSTMLQYDETRDRVFAQPWLASPQYTSAVSPYLRLGMLSIRQAYAAAIDALRGIAPDEKKPRKSVETWVSELVWREFYNHILYHFPHVMERSFRSEYDMVEWRHEPDEFAAWAAGMTGYPIVDAAMRQLAQVGWMPNRARLIVASFLTKDLLHYWRAGDVHFMQHLLDGDPAANNGGWQWTAGTGTDAQPYFRIFNPVSQSMKCDPQGEYIRHFVPELRGVPTQHIHAPWEMASPPQSYPRPMVDHAAARERALSAFQAVRQA